MTKYPKISVILSVYNNEKYISLAIESIINQTFKDFEFIIINDGSTDNTQKIIQNYTKKDNRIIAYQQENSGLTVSLNKCLRIAKAKLIARQDADDYSDPRRLEKQYRFLNENRNITVCFTWHKVVDTNGKHITLFNFSANMNKIHRNINKRRTIYSHGSAMFRRKEILDLGGYDENHRTSQDYYLWKKLIDNNYIIGVLPRYLYNWRIDLRSVSIKNNNVILLKHLQNLYFRDQNRKEIFNNTQQLYYNKKLSFKDVLKLLATIQPFKYNSIFKFF